MTRRGWIVLFVVATIAGVFAALRSCDVEREPRRVAPAAGVPATRDETLPNAPARRHAVAAKDETKPPETPPAPAARPAGATIVVHVVAKETGAPIVGADAFVEDDDEHRTHGATDAAGLARLADVVPRKLRVWAGAEGFVRSNFEEKKPSAGDEFRVEIALERGVALDVVVVDARTGRPIAGAQVEVDDGGDIDGEGPGLRWWTPPLARVVTGADGRLLAWVPPEGIVTTAASSRGFVMGRNSIRVASSGAARATVEVRLEPSGGLRGSVRDADGRPVAGAIVYGVRADWGALVRNPDGAGARNDGEAPKRPLRTTTDADGRYQLDGFSRGGVYVAFATAKGRARSAERRGIFVTDGAPVLDADFTLRRAGSLVLRFVDAEGNPVAAGVDLSGEAARDVDIGVGEDGVLRFEEAEPTTYRVHAVAFGMAPMSTSIEMSEGAVVERTLRFVATVSMDGILVDDRGDSTSGADVIARPTDGSRIPVMTQTGADGRFHLDGLSPGPQTVGVHHRWRCVDTRRTIDAPAKDARIEVQRRGAVKLHVLPPSGAPHSKGLMVMLESFEDGKWKNFSALDCGSFDDVHAGAWLDPGRCRVCIESDEFPPLVREFELASGETLDLGDVVVEAGIDIVGRVEDASDAPITGAQLNFGAPDSSQSLPWMAATGADGAFHLRLAPTGACAVAVRAEGFFPVTLRFDPSPAAPLVIRLSRGGLVHVTVVDAAEVPAAGAHVVVFPAGSSAADEAAKRLAADHLGRCETRLAAGKLRVVVEGRDGAADVDLPEGGETSVRLVVK